MKICIDPGHSGPAEPGAVYAGHTEARLVLQIALHAATHLTALGYDVIMTRTGDIDSDLLAPRAALANGADADMFVSIHANAAAVDTARGVETYHCSGSTEGAALAAAVQRQLIELGCFPDRGVKAASFYVLTATAMPAVLVECGFLSNTNDRAVHASASWRAAIGKAIASGVHEYAAGADS